MWLHRLLRTPRSRLLIWVLTLVLILALPVIAFTYYPLLLRSGTLPPEGDSTMIPMMGTLFASILLAPVLLVSTFIALRGYSQPVSLFNWNKERPLRSAAASVLFGGPALLLAVSIGQSMFPLEPWYEFLWVPYELLLLIWLLTLRAAVVARPATSGRLQLPNNRKSEPQ